MNAVPSLRSPVELPDSYWEAALHAALGACEEARCVLVPAEFLPADARFAPLEYSWGLKGMERLAWCCSKDDVDRLAPWLLDSASYRWANEVFVLGGSLQWSSPADADSERHLVAWQERVQAYRGGAPARPSTERLFAAPAATTRRAGLGRRVLLVGASGMGNVGDDLLAEALGHCLADAGAEVFLSGPDIDPLRVAAYDAVVVGAGGLIYASRDGSNESQNLANYLKFGPIARHFGVRAALIAVGDQDHGGRIEHDELTRTFAAGALGQFHAITTRDQGSAALLERNGAKRVRVGSDALFLWGDRAGAAVRPSAARPVRLALIGEFYRYGAFNDGIGDGNGSLAAQLGEGEFDVLVMSDDDVPHAARMQKALQRAGAAASVVDLRGRRFEALIFLFATYRGIVTTRFHGLVLAAMARVPVLALDVANGKSARLLRQLNALDALIDESGGGGAARLGEALTGRVACLPAAQVRKLAGLSQVHKRTMHALLGLRQRRPASPPRLAVEERAPAVAQSSPGAAERCPAEALVEADAIRLCWAASSRDTQGFANLGDALSAVVVCALAGRPVRHVNFDEPTTKLVGVGSIAHAIRHGVAVVWGAGVSIRGGLLAQNVPLTRYDVRAVRGAISAQHLRDFGIAVPNLYGDPAWLLPSILDEPVEKKYELGVIPHIQDVEGHHPDAPPRAGSLRYQIDAADARTIAIINTWHEPTWDALVEKVRLIRSCKRVLSQSFHGLVIAETYGIPALNFRYLRGARNGPLRVDLRRDCTTDPRVWEFYKGGPRTCFHMYSQQREQRTDWDGAIRAIDTLWEPFEYDATSLVEAFPLPRAYDPLAGGRPKSREYLEAMQL